MYERQASKTSLAVLAFALLLARGLSQSSPPTTSTSLSSSASTLYSYVDGGEVWSSRGEWYNIVAWAARTSNCAQNSSSLACMACSQDLPNSAVANGIAPIAVANGLWFSPERSATCGMCLKVYMPNGSASAADCTDPNSSPLCPGVGSEPYVSSVSEPLNYGAKVQYDAEKQMPYFTAMVIEWLDRNFTDAYSVSYPTQKTEGVDGFGTWPIQYEGTPCPTGGSFLEYQFLNTSSPFPYITATNQTAWLESGSSQGLPLGVGNTLCNNLPNQPCGASYATQNPFSFVKLQITNQRIPISSVDLRMTDNIWLTLKRSGDGYWEPSDGLSFSPDATKPVDIRVTCSDSSPARIEPGLLPYNMLCGYQDPQCARKVGTIQC